MKRKIIEIKYIDPYGKERVRYQDYDSGLFIKKELALKGEIIKTVISKSESKAKKRIKKKEEKKRKYVSLEDKIFYIYDQIVKMCESKCSNKNNPPCKDKPKSCMLNIFYDNCKYHIEMGWFRILENDYLSLKNIDNSSLLREFFGNKYIKDFGIKIQVKNK